VTSTRSRLAERARRDLEETAIWLLARGLSPLDIWQQLYDRSDLLAEAHNIRPLPVTDFVQAVLELLE
jgi:hypothetical protein